MLTSRRDFLKAGASGLLMLDVASGATVELAEEKSGLGSTKTPETPKPFRLLLNTDPNIPRFFVPNKASKSDLEFFVDRLVLGGVDAWAYCIFEGGYTLIHDSKHGDLRPYWIGGNCADVTDCKPDGEKVFPADPFPLSRGYQPIYQAGQDPIRIFTARCRHHGMKFLAGFRMNDRHSGRKGWFQEQHPEWQLREPGHPGDYWRGAMDFTFPEVRQWMLGLMGEAVEKYDFDGLELDYMRWCHVFPPSVARERHPLLTDFMRQTRRILDEASGRKKRKLLLGARVPQRLTDSAALGYNIPVWVEEKLTDYLCPSDFMYTDFNASYEEFTRLTQPTGCAVYPSIHPLIASGVHGALLTPANYRAAAQRFYASGADGISLYNFQYHWQQQINLRYPGVPSNYVDILRFLNELKSLDSVAGGTRHYLFYPLWPKNPPTDVEGVEGTNRMTLLERSAMHQRRVFRFKLGEKDGPGQPHSQLLFTAVNLSSKDEIKVDFNGQQVSPASLQWLYEPTGLKASYRRTLGPYSAARFFLLGLPIKSGLNELGLTLLRSDPNSTSRIEVQEVEVIIEPT